MHYFAGKIGKDNWFDHRKTIKGIRLDIIERRKSDTMTKDLARELWHVVDGLEDESNETAFTAMAYECDELWKMYGGDSPAQYGIDPGFRNFWAICWPVFLEYLKTE